MNVETSNFVKICRLILNLVTIRQVVDSLRIRISGHTIIANKLSYLQERKMFKIKIC